MSDQKENFLVDMSQDENIYLMGLLWADGWVGKKYGISIELKNEDFEYIRPLFEKFGFSKFRERQRYKNNKIFGNVQKQFIISSVVLNKRLRKFGYRNKSIVAPSKVLSIIPKNKHYLWWRGFFDGDGCFYCKGASHSFTVWGSFKQNWKELLCLYNDIGIKNPRIKTYQRKNGTHCSSCVSITIKNDIIKLGNYIYSNKLSIGFKRKYEKYLKCVSTAIPLYKKKKSEKNGIYFSVWTGKWICRKFINKKRIVIGSFSNYEEACKAYDDFISYV